MTRLNAHKPFKPLNGPEYRFPASKIFSFILGASKMTNLSGKKA